ncbi:MAG: antibiotic biosynthesis monooxygenase [Burkholderiales bacterium]|jgi:heme-degrading monooxygenase HmoA|nr:antibiotic biosynthesis monooxygenase [Burkholderiales bacterium]
MFAVIFEVTPDPTKYDQYLGIASDLKSELVKIDGFLENERFRLNGSEGKLLSFSLWRDEKSLIRWRTHSLHHLAQERGRTDILIAYHLRVGEIDYMSGDGMGAIIERCSRQDLTEVDPLRYVTISLKSGGAGELIEPEVRLSKESIFTCINDAGKFLVINEWKSPEDGLKWLSCQSSTNVVHYGVRVIRSYGLTDRREATMFLP